jgi:hypothetical protein
MLLLLSDLAISLFYLLEYFANGMRKGLKSRVSRRRVAIGKWIAELGPQTSKILSGRDPLTLSLYSFSEQRNATRSKLG